MNRFFASACLVLATAMVHAQGTMNFHHTNGSTVLVNMAEIDSVVYQLEPPPPLMHVYETGGSVQSYPVAAIDSITYSPGGVPGTAQVATFPPASVGFSGALCSGMVGEPGDSPVVARGICYGTAPLPDLTASSALASGTTGPFQVQLSGLQLGTTYYARAFATNAQGTSYANQVAFSTLSNSNLNPNINYGSMTDQDGNTYATVVIGVQEWMAENLRVTTYANGDTIPNVTNNSQWTLLTTGAWSEIGNSGKLYNRYAATDPRSICPQGWHVPNEADWFQLELLLGVPPSELESVQSHGVSQNAGGKMKTTSVWSAPNTGANNESGFSARTTGRRSSITGLMDGFGTLTAWWSWQPEYPGETWLRYVMNSSAGIWRTTWAAQMGLCVRCVNDNHVYTAGLTGTPQVATLQTNPVFYTGAVCAGSVGESGDSPVVSRGICYGTSELPDIGGSTALTFGTTGSFQIQLTGLLPGTTYYARAFATNAQGTAYGNQVDFTTLTYLNTAIEYGSMTDQEGNTYQTIIIGTQEWMAENLRTTTYASGDPIAHVTNNSDWSQMESGAWCHYSNIENNEFIYGKLYNWYAAASPNICPQGWHLPTDADWQQLESALGMPTQHLEMFGSSRGVDQNVGRKLLSAALWGNGNAEGANESGFSGIPAGLRVYSSGIFGNVGSQGNFWSASESDMNSALCRELSTILLGVSRLSRDKRFGYCLRCVRD
jgi:uncharacterized protein (TIGR02145 family)